MTAVIKETPRRGWETGPLVIFGHSIIEFILLVGLLLGLDVILQTMVAELVISYVGGILLCVLAALMLIDVFVKKISIEKELNQLSSEDKKKTYKPILDGIILSLSNPFWIIWWATIGIGLIYTELPPLAVVPIEFGLIGLIIFYIGHILSDFTWYTFISGMIAKGKRWINDRVYHVILVLCAAFLIYLGVTFILNGIALS